MTVSHQTCACMPTAINAPARHIDKLSAAQHLTWRPYALTRALFGLVQYAMWWGAAVCVASTTLVWTHTTTAVIHAHVFVCASGLGIGHEPPAKDHEMTPGQPSMYHLVNIHSQDPTMRQNNLLLPSWGWRKNNIPAPSAHPHPDMCCTGDKLRNACHATVASTCPQEANGRAVHTPTPHLVTTAGPPVSAPAAYPQTPKPS